MGRSSSTKHSPASFADEKDTEEEDLFAENKKRKVSMKAFARDKAFVSVQAAKHWLAKFGELTQLADMSVYKINESQKVLLNNTIAVCAIRSNGNRVTSDMVTALLRVVKPKTAQEVRTLHRWANMLQYIEQFRLVLSVFTVSAPTNSIRLRIHGAQLVLKPHGRTLRCWCLSDVQRGMCTCRCQPGSSKSVATQLQSRKPVMPRLSPQAC